MWQVLKQIELVLKWTWNASWWKTLDLEGARNETLIARCQQQCWIFWMIESQLLWAVEREQSLLQHTHVFDIHQTDSINGYLEKKIFPVIMILVCSARYIASRFSWLITKTDDENVVAFCTKREKMNENPINTQTACLRD